MKVTVIIPIYHGENYISHLEEMLLENQTNFKNGEIETIFINDSPEICINVKVGRIIINEKNCGIQVSRIRGIKESSGEYITFWDQDDEFEPDYISSQIKKIGSSDAIVCNGYNGENIIYSNNQKFTKKEFWKKDVILSPGQVVIKKSAIPLCWINTILKTSGADDYFLWILMILNNKTICYNSEILYKHINHLKNTSKNNMVMKKSIEEIEDILLTNKLVPNTSPLITVSLARYSDFYQMRNDLVNISTIDIERYLKKIKIKSIAIWGYGNIGKLFVEKIPKYINLFIYDKSELLFGKEEEDWDIGVVTALFYYDEIKETIETTKHHKVMPISKFLSNVISLKN